MFPEIGVYQQAIPPVGAHRFGVCVLLRFRHDHPIRRHVVPPIRHPFADPGLGGTQNVQ